MQYPLTSGSSPNILESSNSGAANTTTHNNGALWRDFIQINADIEFLLIEPYYFFLAKVSNVLENQVKKFKSQNNSCHKDLLSDKSEKEIYIIFYHYFTHGLIYFYLLTYSIFWTLELTIFALFAFSTQYNQRCFGSRLKNCSIFWV